MTRNEELAAAFEAAAKEYEPPQTVQPCWTTARALRAIAAVYRQAAEREASQAAETVNPWRLGVEDVHIGIGFNAEAGPGIWRSATNGCQSSGYEPSIPSQNAGSNLTAKSSTGPLGTLESERDCGCPAGECLFYRGHDPYRHVAGHLVTKHPGIGYPPILTAPDGTTCWPCGRVTLRG